jgi:hypothetical protein
MQDQPTSRERILTSAGAVRLAWAQGLYFLVTGVWPLVSVRTFQLVTGKKSDHLIATPPSEADHWMLNTISALIIAISIVVLAAAWRRRVSFDVARGTILPIYLADAAVEVLIIGVWIWVLAKGDARSDSEGGREAAA